MNTKGWGWGLRVLTVATIEVQVFPKEGRIIHTQRVVELVDDFRIGPQFVPMTCHGPLNTFWSAEHDLSGTGMKFDVRFEQSLAVAVEVRGCNKHQ